jgi:6,7-dimethyl-8-ribityllumazine synthase
MKILIVQANFYHNISSLLLKGAEDYLKQNNYSLEDYLKTNYSYSIITVPGALEIPAVIAKLKNQYQGFVALGCIIRGETSHYDIVCNQSAYGLMKLSVDYGIAIGNGILTTENEDQAIKRADPLQYNKGKLAVESCLTVAKITNR